MLQKFMVYVLVCGPLVKTTNKNTGDPRDKLLSP